MMPVAPAVPVVLPGAPVVADFAVPEASGAAVVPAETTLAGEDQLLELPPEPGVELQSDLMLEPVAGVPIGSVYADGPTLDEQAVTEEERKLAFERAARRDARTAALTAEAPIEAVTGAPIRAVPMPAPTKRTTDGFWASLGLFLLRMVLAAIFAVRGIQMLLEPAKSQEMLAKTVLPSSMVPLIATVIGVACLLVAVAMILGLATRAAGLGAAAITGGALALVYWGASFSIFRDFNPADLEFGFWGEEQLLITVVGLLVLFIGAGGWSVDHSLRATRAREKARGVS